MKYFTFWLFSFTLLFGCNNNKNSADNANTSAETSVAPSLIIHNGKLATMTADNDFAEALAVRDGLIQQVGKNADILALRGSDTKVIDLQGRTVIPGLNDSHTHVVRAGLNYNMELRWDGVTSLKRAMEMLKEQAARTPDGEWVRVVGGWTEHQFEEKRLPTLAEINAAVPDKPVFILYLYSLGFINKKGIELLGYDKDTYYPGGEIELDQQGQVTGFLVAKPSALLLYSTLVQLPKLSPEQQANSTLHYIRDLNRLGVTSAVDAGGGGQFYPDNYEVAKALAKQGKLNLRIGYYLFATKKGTELDDFQKWTAEESIGQNDAMLKPNGYHLCGAGENIVWSAADFENFLEPRPVLAKMMEKELTTAITLFAKNKWPFRIHATYDESITRFLDVFEKVDVAYPFLQEIRWIIDHAETVSDANLPLEPTIGMRTELISGDRDRDNPDLQTFNAFYPRGAYFGLIALIGPANLIDVHPFVSVPLLPDLEFTFDWDVFWRHRTTDGIYGPNKALERSGRNSTQHYIGHQPRFEFAYQQGRYLSFSFEGSYFVSGPFFTETGSAADVLHFAAACRFKF